ncbi:MAG TPA: methyltransferase, partial [Hyphomonas sp.]|nr:methyltransferase [Hyphomonas sp.]
QEMEAGVWSRPGLFSWNRIDAGSELLADSVPENIRGRGADFG